MAASAIEDIDVKQWEDLSEGNTKIWTADRFASFKQLVNHRRYRMYRGVFNSMQWDEWIKAING